MSDPTTAETPTMRHEAYMDSEKTFCRRCGAVEGTDAWADDVCAGWNPEDNPAPVETPTMRERLLGSCVGSPAEISWPHRLLHDAADHVEGLETALRGCIKVLESHGLGHANVHLARRILNETQD